MMNIRQANSGDIKAVKKIADLLYLEIPDFVWNTEEFIKGQIEKGEYYVTEDGLNVIGIVSLRERNNMLYIETLAVAKNIQAKGVGSKLVEFTKQFAKENDFKILRTTSFYEYNVKDFWLKHGFRLLEEPGEYSGHKFYRFEMSL
jgi:N-acetylglutamate synthase-like GNAT family acetyltransferase